MTAGDEESARPQLALTLLPWHAAARSKIETAIAGGRLPHALLLHGPDGVGKERFAAVIAAGLFCSRRRDGIVPCGECPDCTLGRAGSHPDLHWLRRPEDKKTIGVDQIRDAAEQLGMTSLRSRHRVAIAVPAHVMTANAQNALLKTLEEPAPRTLLVLVTSRPSSLLATLRSRCQRVEIPRPSVEQALEWLREELGSSPPPGLLDLAGGAPLKAVGLAPHAESLEAQMPELLEELLAGRREVTRVAADLLGDGLSVRLDWLEGWFARAVRRRLLPDATRLTVPGGPLLQKLATEVNITAAFRIVDRLRESRRLLEGSAAAQLVVESLLLEFKSASRRTGVATWVP